MARKYKKVVAWQRAHELTLAIYKLTRSFPDDERFGMTSQLRRSAYSVAANIVEGTGRETNKDYLRFLIISRASLKEVEYFLLLGHDLSYMNEVDYNRLASSVNDTMRPLSGLIKAIEKETGVFGRIQATFVAAATLALATASSPFT